MKRRYFIFAIFLICIVFLVLFVGIPLAKKVSQYKTEREDYTRRTTPLPVETVKDICIKLHLSEQESRCKDGATVYAPEFFDDIKKYFKNIPKEQATQQEVDNILGRYKMRCSPPSKLSNGKIYYRCLYDLRGDEVSIIGIYFHNDGTIDYIMASTGGS